MHTLFTLEDLYGLKITELDGEVCLHLDKGMGTNYITMFEMFSPLLSHYLYFLRLAPLAIIFSIFYYLDSSNSNIEFFPVLELLIF